MQTTRRNQAHSAHCISSLLPAIAAFQVALLIRVMIAVAVEMVANLDCSFYLALCLWRDNVMHLIQGLFSALIAD